MISQLLGSLFSNTLINIYFVYVIISFSISFYFVILPINRLRIDWGLTLKNGNFGLLREFLSELNSYKKNTKKVRDYLIFESFLAILPLIIILIFRLILEPGDVGEFDYKVLLYSLMLAMLVIWTLYDSVSFKSSIEPWLKKHQKWYHLDKTRNPEFIFPMLSFTSLSRKKLGVLGKLEVPEYIEDEQELKAIRKQSTDDDSKTEFDTEAVKENISIIGSRIKTKFVNTLIKGKEITKNLAKETDDRIAKFFDDKMSDKVDELTEISSYRFVYWAIYSLRLAMPVICIYIFF